MLILNPPTISSSAIGKIKGGVRVETVGDQSIMDCRATAWRTELLVSCSHGDQNLWNKNFYCAKRLKLLFLLQQHRLITLAYAMSLPFYKYWQWIEYLENYLKRERRWQIHWTSHRKWTHTHKKRKKKKDWTVCIVEETALSAVFWKEKKSLFFQFVLFWHL